MMNEEMTEQMKSIVSRLLFSCLGDLYYNGRFCSVFFHMFYVLGVLELIFYLRGFS